MPLPPGLVTIRPLEPDAAWHNPDRYRSPEQGPRLLFIFDDGTSYSIPISTTGHRRWREMIEDRIRRDDRTRYASAEIEPAPPEARTQQLHEWFGDVISLNRVKMTNILHDEVIVEVEKPTKPATLWNHLLGQED